MEYLSRFGMYCSELLTMTLKVAYPTYASHKAICTEGTSDDTTWLIYWVVVAVQMFIEAYVFPFVSWVPFFMLLRLLFHIWLQIPIFNGSVVIFKRFVQPFFEENETFMNVVTNANEEDVKAAREKRRKARREAYEKILKSIENPKEKTE